MAEIIKFAQDFGVDTKLYDRFTDYYCHFMSQNHGKSLGVYDETVSLADKETQMNEALLSEVGKLANVSLSKDNALVMSKNPQVKWATFALIDSLIAAVLPVSVNENIGKFADMRTIGFGDQARFLVEPQQFFVVSEGTHGERFTFLQKQFKEEKTLEPRLHEVSVTTSMYRVLCGLESLAEFVRRAILSIENNMTAEAWNALEGALDAAEMPAPFVVTGYTPEDLLALCQRVEAYNGGNKPIIYGSSVALSKVLPDGAQGFRMNTPADKMALDIIYDFYGYNVVPLKQIAANDGAYGTVISDDEIYILSSADKPVKGVLQKDMSWQDEFLDNADLTQNAKILASYAFATITNAVAGKLIFA